MEIKKEPWQMTQGEYIRLEQQEYRREAKARGDAAYKPISKKEGGYRFMREGRRRDRARIEEFGREIHRARVVRALAAGKPVPATVLNDYPELVRATS
mgnify:CR=1 FL=1